MGFVGKILSFVRATRNGADVSDVKIDPGGGPKRTAEHFAPSGDDSHPLTTDYVYAAPTARRGHVAAVGYIDPLNTPKADEGDKRIYARDSGGAVVVELWLKNTGEALLTNSNGSVTLNPDGSIIGQNSAGSFELEAAGDFVVNGVVIATDGTITTPTSLVTPSAVVNSVEVNGHNHTQANDSGGNTEQDTGPMQ